MCLVNVEFPKYDVLVVNNNTEIRKRICKAIQADSELTVWGEAGSVTEVCNLLKYGLPALAVIDPGLPDSDDQAIISWLNKHAPYVKTLVPPMLDSNRKPGIIKESGASVYLHYYDQPENILCDIRQALSDRQPILTAVRQTTQNAIKMTGANSRTPEPVLRTKNKDKTKLTPAELDILNYIAKGFTGPEIADITGRSVNTVPVHMKSIYRKLSVSGRGEAVFRALQLGLIDQDPM